MSNLAAQPSEALRFRVRPYWQRLLRFPVVLVRMYRTLRCEGLGIGVALRWAFRYAGIGVKP